MEHDWSFLYDPRQFGFMHWAYIGAFVYGYFILKYKSL